MKSYVRCSFILCDAFYFYDASGNVVEFIVRYDLRNEDDEDFDISKVLAVNEMGVPTSDIEKLNKQLENEIHTSFWKGDLKRFGTNGSQEGIFLIPNYTVKNSWFPTLVEIKSEPFDARIESGGKEYKIEFENEKLKVTNYKV